MHALSTYKTQFEDMYVSNYARMKRFAQQYLIREEDAENIVHDLFLEQGKSYLAHIYEDSPKVKTRTKVSVKVLKVTRETVIQAKLQPSGGQAIRICKVI